MMHALLEKLVLLIKKRPMVIDRRISSGYLLGLMMSNCLLYTSPSPRD